MGDRAAAYLWVAEWRKRSPLDKILVIDDPFKGDAPDGLQLDAVWLFNGIADEVWLTERKGEHIEHPGAYPLYHTNLWRIWLWLRNNKTAVPQVKPKQESIERTQQLRKQYKVPEKYITLQPLFDAPYNAHRNAPIEWWRGVTKKLKNDYPIVLLGTSESAKGFKPMEGVYPLWDEKLTPMDSLALIRDGAAHIGGETGLTLWAPFFDRPTVAIYSYWSTTGGSFPMDCRPMPFGAPVEHAMLKGSFDTVAEKLKKVLC